MGANQQMLAGGAPVVVGQQAYTTAGSYTWVCPDGVTSVSVVCIGGGGMSSNISNGGGGGGGLDYVNDISVIPGSSYTVVVGAGASTGDGGASSFNGASVSAGGGGVAGGNDAGGTYGGGSVGGVNGASGAVRIIWPGNLRQFPSTRTADE